MAAMPFGVRIEKCGGQESLLITTTAQLTASPELTASRLHHSFPHCQHLWQNMFKETAQEKENENGLKEGHGVSSPKDPTKSLLDIIKSQDRKEPEEQSKYSQHYHKAVEVA